MMNYSDHRNFSRKISIETNQKCNLNCIYCYEQMRSEGTLNIDRIKRVLSKELSTKTEQGTIIDFHGGEPFLIFQTIKELCEWLWSKNLQEHFIIHTTTNGTLIHGDIQKWLIKNRERFFVKLSLDGTKKAHNINRNNSFEDIDLQFFLRNWPQVALKMTISKQSLPFLAESIIFFHNNRFQNIQSSLAGFVGWGSTRDQRIFKKQLSILNDYYLKYPNISRCSLYDIPFEHLLDPDNLSWYQKPCLTGRKIAYDIYGIKKYPCHLLIPSVTKMAPYNASNFLTIDKKSLSSYVSEECMNCVVKPICRTCYGINQLYRGSICARDMGFCVMEKIRIASVSKFEYLRLIEKDTVGINQTDYIKMHAISKIVSWINKTLN